MIYIIGIGSNLPSKHGSSINSLKFAVKKLNQNNIRVIKKSFLYSSPPKNFSSAANTFFNGAIMVDSTLKPESLLFVLKSIEKNLGRNIYKKNSSRTCDLDILLVKSGGLSATRENNSKCILPHPRIHEREFVLKPMMDICPNWIHTERNQSIYDIYKSRYTGEKLYKIAQKL